MQNRMTKWLEIRALRRTTTPVILRQLTDLILLRHDCSEDILSDNGNLKAVN